MPDAALVLAVLFGVVGLGMVIVGAAPRFRRLRMVPRLRRRHVLLDRLVTREKRAVVVEDSAPDAPRERRSLLPKITALLSKTRAEPLMRQLEQALALAQIPLKPAEFIYVAAAALFVALLVVQLTTNSILMSLAITLMAGFAPFYYLRFTQRLRFLRIDAQVADSLLLMTNSLRAGASFMDAMDAVAREMPPPISEEFARAIRDISLGVPVDESFVKMTTRCRSEDLDLAVTAFKIQREVGGNLAEILENIAATIRERVKLKQEIGTLSAQGKMSGGILCLLPIGLTAIMNVLNPDYLKVLFTSEEGKMLVGAAVVLQIIGVLAITRIIKIEA